MFDLSFAATHRFRPFALVAPGFAAVEEGAPAVGDGGDSEALVRADAGPVAPYAAVEVDVAPVELSGRVAVGLATADDQHVLVTWTPRSSRLAISVRRRGRTRVVRRRKVALPASFRLAFVLNEQQVTGLVDTGDGWRPVLTERTRVAALVDLRREDELAAHAYAWGGGTLTAVRAGLFGMVGLRDPHLVQHADGTPYVRDGRHWLTWTCAGLGFFQQAHWSVWSVDLADPERMRLESQLFSRRDGRVLGDHAGHLVRDGDRWLVATSSWGDFGAGSIHVRHTSTRADLLTGVHVLDTEPTALPTPHGTWDPALLRVDDRWHVAFVESPSQQPFRFGPALATTTAAAWTEGLSAVPTPVMRQCEGTVLVTVGDRPWLLASDADERCYPVLDLEGRRVGRLDAPYLTNIPHPQLVADPAGGWLVLTFDGTAYERRVLGYGGHGDVVVLHSR
ncbi:hypothetical protein H5V45_07865 [Nocardioides sp. KIGAM211]|uniref:Uncharacterized protein n=1 Tax=Nocardioides luti TaxID=2761101 RepID=A0A7X0VA58_9ACTN|nr:hypothetical protein [Nocardioides luti]MBB6627236.1 hypothetical protein [Nocardioides luti]